MVACGGCSGSETCAGGGVANVCATPSSATQIGAGVQRTCALTSAGAVKCWGANNYGSLGTGTMVSSAIPVDVVGLGSGVTALAVGAYHACALTSQSGVKCWGNNADGQLGDGSTTDSPTPVTVTSLANAIAIAAGHDHTCAVTSAGDVQCWGNNSDGQLGNNSTNASHVPLTVPGLTGIKAVSASEFGTCSLSTGQGLKCWGREPGNGTVFDSKVPVDVMSGVAAATSGGWGFTCAVTTAGAVRCWGTNTEGALGDSTFASSDVPVGAVGLASGVTALGAGFDHACAVTSVSGVSCWGSNDHGQVGDGSTTNRGAPVIVSGLGGSALAVAGGNWHTCAILAGGHLRCWGFNSGGALGDGTQVESHVPVAVMGF